MNVPLIEMDPSEAAVDLELYAAGLRRRHDEEHEAVLRGLESLVAGESVISLPAAFEAADFAEDTGLPELAIARADRRWCRLELQRNSKTMLFDTRSPRATVGSDSLQVRLDLPFPARDLFTDEPEWSGWRAGGSASWWAPVPMIPPIGVKLAGGGSRLREHFVLWDVEHWATSKPRAIPPYDPYLLKPLGGDLYSVVHEWDLTAIERAVMAGRS